MANVSARPIRKQLMWAGISVLLAVGVLSSGTNVAAADPVPSVCDAVAANIVANCGFEQGSDTTIPSWTVTPNTRDESGDITDADDEVHSGSQAYEDGVVGAPDTLSQTLTGARAASTYSVTFWVFNDVNDDDAVRAARPAVTPDDLAPGLEFVLTADNVLLDGGGTGTATLFTDTGQVSGDYTQFSATFSTPLAMRTAPVLRFTIQNNPAFYYLDDVEVVRTGTSVALGPPPSPFNDVSADNPFAADITWLSTYGYAKGYPDGGFHPTAQVTREAAAAILQRYEDPQAATTCAKAPFTDVPKSSPFCAAISWLVSHKIATGFSDGSFHPKAAVSRQELAAFLYRMAHHGATAPACTKAAFSDVPAASSFCGAITWLVSKGIAEGNTDGTFHPGQPVLREQLARFLHSYATYVD